MRLWSLAIAVAVLAGCSAPAATEEPAIRPAPDTPSDAPARHVLAARSGDATEFDAACLGGPDTVLQRGEARVLPPAQAITIRLDVPLTYSGYQAGYAVDGAPAEWLPAVGPGSAQTFTVPVEGRYEEDGQARWEFRMRANVEGQEQECYTGAGTGALLLEVTTEY